jgi:hypothetical protein
MADFSLTTLFVSPVGNTLPSSGSTQNLTPGQFGIFKNDYTYATAGNIAAAPYFYVAQGRVNTYLQGSKRSDKIAGALNSGGNGKSNVTEWYKVTGSPVAANQVTEVVNFNVKPGEIITLTLRAFSSYINTLYFNGFTRSVTVNAPCLACGGDPCSDVDVPELIDRLIYQLELKAPGNNPDNISFSTFYQFQRIGDDQNAKLVISGKPLTQYGQPCDVAAFPWEYDRMWFRTFIYAGPATTADFIVADPCNVVAEPVVTQRSSYVAGTSAEIQQLEKNFYSYQAGYLKHLYRMVGYNENFESWVTTGTTYDTFYIKFNDYDKSAYQWGDYIYEDATVIIAVPQAQTSAVNAILAAALGAAENESAPITSTTSTTTTVWPSTSTTTTQIP